LEETRETNKKKKPALSMADLPNPFSPRTSSARPAQQIASRVSDACILRRLDERIFFHIFFRIQRAGLMGIDLPGRAGARQ
jgi:hypothetical protein